MDTANVSAQGSNEVSVSNQRSVGKVRVYRMPKITHVGKRAKITKGPAKKIGKV